MKIIEGMKGSIIGNRLEHYKEEWIEFAEWMIEEAEILDKIHGSCSEEIQDLQGEMFQLENKMLQLVDEKDEEIGKLTDEIELLEEEIDRMKGIDIGPQPDGSEL